MNKMKVRFVDNDRVEVRVMRDTHEVRTHVYRYGYNMSPNRELARLAEETREKAIKYKWKGAYILKPFVGDILCDLAQKYKVPKSDIYYSGHCSMTNRELTQIELQIMLDRIMKETL